MPVTVPSRPKQRRDGGDGPERAEKALELVHHVPARVLDRLLHDLAALVHVREARGKDAPERRVVGQRLDVALVEALRFDQLPDAVRELARDHPLALQRPQALEDDGGGDHRAEDDRPHDGAAGEDDFPHGAA